MYSHKTSMGKGWGYIRSHDCPSVSPLAPSVPSFPSCLVAEPNTEQLNSTSPPLASYSPYSLPVIEPLQPSSIQFYGHPGTFRPFKTRFNCLMKKGKIDEDLQVEYLLRSLKGEALRIGLMSDLEDPQAFKQIWQHLEERYGGAFCDYQLHAMELQKLATFPQCKTPEDLRELYYVYSENISALRNISKNPAAGDDYKTTLVQLLPDSLRRKVLKTIQEEFSEYKLDSLLKIIGKEVALDNMQSAFKVNPPISKRGHKQSNSEKGERMVTGTYTTTEQSMETRHEGFNYVTARESAITPVNKFETTVEPTDHTTYTTNISTLPTFVADSAVHDNRRRPTSPEYLSSGSIQSSNEALYKPCIFCGNHHESRECTVFEDQQFIKILKAEGRCFNCYSQQHIIYCCPYRSMCQSYGCQRKTKHSPFHCRSRCATKVNKNIHVVQATKNNLQGDKFGLGGKLAEEENTKVLLDETVQLLNTENKNLLDSIASQATFIQTLSKDKDKISTSLNKLQEELTDQMEHLDKVVELKTKIYAQRALEEKLEKQPSEGGTKVEEVVESPGELQRELESVVPSTGYEVLSISDKRQHEGPESLNQPSFINSKLSSTPLCLLMLLCWHLPPLWLGLMALMIVDLVYLDFTSITKVLRGKLSSIQKVEADRENHWRRERKRTWIHWKTKAYQQVIHNIKELGTSLAIKVQGLEG